MICAMKVRRVVQEEIDVPGLGARIKAARLAARAQGRSLGAMCTSIGLSRNYWYQLEKEEIRGAVSEETLRKVEAVLEVDLGVEFNG